MEENNVNLPKDFPDDLRRAIESKEMTYQEAIETIDYLIWFRQKYFPFESQYK